MKNKNQETRNAFLILAHYALGYSIVYPIILSMLALSLNPNATSYPVWMQFAFYIFMIASMVALFWKTFAHDAKDWLANAKPYFLKVLRVALLMYVANFFISIIVGYVSPNDTSGNQAIIQDVFNQTPVLTIFMACVFAPIVEEIVFRGVIFKQIRKHSSFWLASLTSALLFGLIHIQFGTSFGFADLLYIFVYGALGFFMCKAYEDTGNFFGAVCLHFINNALAILVMML
ncbi:MAG: lysostaphin resistance A-like protein [Erysipelotrichaceae bacterium]